MITRSNLQIVVLSFAILLGLAVHSDACVLKGAPAFEDRGGPMMDFRAAP